MIEYRILLVFSFSILADTIIDRVGVSTWLLILSSILYIVKETVDSIRERG